MYMGQTKSGINVIRKYITDKRPVHVNKNIITNKKEYIPYYSFRFMNENKQYGYICKRKKHDTWTVYGGIEYKKCELNTENLILLLEEQNEIKSITRLSVPSILLYGEYGNSTTKVYNDIDEYHVTFLTE